MSDDGGPADPFADKEDLFTAELDSARTLRLALVDMPDLASVFRATAALSDDELRWVVFEYALTAWWSRHRAG